MGRRRRHRRLSLQPVNPPLFGEPSSHMQALLASFLAPTDTLRAVQTCRRWRRHAMRLEAVWRPFARAAGVPESLGASLETVAAWAASVQAAADSLSVERRWFHRAQTIRGEYWVSVHALVDTRRSPLLAGVVCLAEQRTTDATAPRLRRKGASHFYDAAVHWSKRGSADVPAELRAQMTAAPPRWRRGGWHVPSREDRASADWRRLEVRRRFVLDVRTLQLLPAEAFEDDSLRLARVEVAGLPALSTPRGPGADVLQSWARLLEDELHRRWVRLYRRSTPIVAEHSGGRMRITGWRKGKAHASTQDLRLPELREAAAGAGRRATATL